MDEGSQVRQGFDRKCGVDILHFRPTYKESVQRRQTSILPEYGWMEELLNKLAVTEKCTETAEHLYFCKV